jgi:hypothetical protein
MTTAGEPSLVLELKPSRPPRGRGATRWLRWAVLIALVGVVLAVGWVIGRHTNAYLHFRSLGAEVHWRAFDTTNESGVSVIGLPAANFLEDRDLEWLGLLYHLKMVDLTGCEHVTDRGVAVLARFEGLKELHLSHQLYQREGRTNIYLGPALTDAGLASLKGLKNLEVLSVDGAEITDAGLEALLEMPRLEVLDLSKTKVSDAGLETLKRIKKLRFVRLDGSRVTCQGAQALQEALPDLRVLLENCEVNRSKEAAGDAQ